MVRVVEAVRAVPLEHVAPLAAALALTVMFVHVVFRRLAYPYDLEWLTGSILDHIERVQTGRPVYAAPTADWIPFMYPPLFYWLAAFVMKGVPVAVGPRLVSLASCLVQAYCVWRLAYWHGATRVWSLIGVGLFFAAFSYTGFSYDLERADSLFAALMAMGTTMLCESTGAAGALIGGALVGVGFFAKQPAVLFVASGVIALLLRREPDRALVFGVSAASIIAAGTTWLHIRTGGWFTYYVIQMPLAHGMERGNLARFFVGDLTKGFALTLAAAALWVSLARGSRKDAVFACALLAAFAASATSRLHEGGWDNVLLVWSTFAVAAVAISGSRVDEALPHSTVARAGVGAIVMLQFGLWSYDPHAMHPHGWQRAITEKFDDKIRRLEASGREVLVLGRGHLTAPRHFHIAALVDVMRVEGQLPPRIARAFAERRFADIVIDDGEELQMLDLPELDQQLFRLVAANYYVAERLEPQAPPVAGFAGHPSLILRPRTQILDATDLARLQLHFKIEVLLAESRMWATLANVRQPDEQPSIEDLARVMVAQPMIGDIVLR